jgi:hypothetical protein
MLTNDFLNKRRTLVSISLLLAVALTVIPIVSAGTGSLRISPALPALVSSPADFETWAQSGSVKDPHIFLVMTKACHDGLTGNVVVKWAGGSITIQETEWTQETDDGHKVPPGTTSGAGYTVSSLKSHLTTADPVYWVFKPFLGGQTLTQTHVSFNVTLPSTNPKMLVYVLGKSGSADTGTSAASDLFDARVPPTIPGLVIPELGPLLLASSSFAALGFYAVKRRRIRNTA